MQMNMWHHLPPRNTVNILLFMLGHHTHLWQHVHAHGVSGLRLQSGCTGFLPAKLTCSRSRRANLRNTQSSFRAYPEHTYPTAVLYRVQSVRDLCPLTCWCDRRPVWWHWTPLDCPASPWPPPPDTPTASEPPDLESSRPPEHDCSRHPTTTDTRETALSDETLNIRERDTIDDCDT